MRLTHTLLIIFFLITSTVVSQNAKIDSLEIVLENHKGKDTTRVNLLNDLAFSYLAIDASKSYEYEEEASTIARAIYFKKGIARALLIKGKINDKLLNFDDALKSTEEALGLYTELKYKEGIAECYFDIGIQYYNQGNMVLALKNYSKSLDVYKTISNEERICQLHNLFGNAYSNLGKYSKALMAYQKAIDLSIKLKNEERTSDYINNIGIIYGEHGNYPLALEYFKKSLFLKEKLNDTIGFLGAYANVGLIYKLTKNYDKAISYYDKALRIQETLDDKLQIVRLLNNLGLAYQEKKEYKTALEYLRRALSISEESQNTLYQGISLNNIAHIYSIQNDNGNAEKCYNKAKNLHHKLEHKYGLSTSYLGLARVYLSQGQHNEAFKSLIKCKRISEELNLLKQQRDVQELLSIIYGHSTNYKEAYLSHQKFKTLNDSLFNKENIEKITQLEYEYKYKRQIDSASIRELKLTEQVTATSRDLEKSKQNYLWAIIGFLFISMLLGSIIFYQKFRAIKAKNQTIATEQKLLRSQMTPHFIFNSLSVLQGMILNKEDKKSVSYLSKFSKLMRITLENSRDKLVLLSQELLAIENYLALQNLENESYQYSISVDNTIDSDVFQIPPMLIQPFVENAIEHAFTENINPKIIDINLNYSNKNLICTITDNGIGINAQKDIKNGDKTSLATTITSERLKILSNDLKVKGWVTIEDRQNYNEQGTIVTLVIPHKLVEA